MRHIAREAGGRAGRAGGARGGAMPVAALDAPPAAAPAARPPPPALVRRAAPARRPPAPALATLLAAPEPAVGAATQPLGKLPQSYPPLGSVQPYETETLVLSNGLSVLLMEDHEVGAVSGTLLAQGGWRMEPEGRPGLSAIAATVQRSGGTLAHPKAKLDARLEDLAAGVEAAAGTNTSSVSFSCLSEDLDEVLSLFGEVTLAPALPQNELALQKALAIDTLARRKDDPGGLAPVELRRRIYGLQSPASVLPTKASIGAISRAEIASFLSRSFRPDGATLGIVGDFDRARIEELLESTLGQAAWPRPDTPLEAMVEVPPPPPREARLVLIDRPGLTQAYVAAGEAGTTLQDADTPALNLLGEVLNGFGGTLFDQLRTREGLAYTVYARFSPEYAFEGIFQAGGQTQSARLAEFITSLRRVLGEAASAPPDNKLLGDAKQAQASSFVFSQASSGSQLGTQLALTQLGLPKDLDFQLREAEQRLTGRDVFDAAARRLHPEEQTVVVVADAGAVRESLRTLGMPIEEISSADLWEDL